VEWSRAGRRYCHSGLVDQWGGEFYWSYDVQFGMVAATGIDIFTIDGEYAQFVCGGAKVALGEENDESALRIT
jgi:hypothetical protein